MAIESAAALDRLLRVQEQQANLLKLKLLSLSAEIAKHEQAIRRLRADIDAAATRETQGWALTSQSAWLDATLRTIERHQQSIRELRTQHAAVEEERLQIERRSEALQTILDQWHSERKQERLRQQQHEMDEIVLRTRR